MQRIQGLYISKIKNKGRAVFSAIDIQAGSLLEVCPILRIPQNEVCIIHEQGLHDYYCGWG